MRLHESFPSNGLTGSGESFFSWGVRRFSGAGAQERILLLGKAKVLNKAGILGILYRFIIDSLWGCRVNKCFPVICSRSWDRWIRVESSLVPGLVYFGISIVVVL